MKRKTAVCMLALIMGLAAASGAAEKSMEKTFTGFTSLRIQTVSGDCEIEKGEKGKIQVRVVWDVDPEDAFEPEFRETGSTLQFKERWTGRRTRGQATWHIRIADGMEIDFSTASGDLRIEDLEIDVEAGTASGDLTIGDSKGNFELETASGDILLTDCSGEFDISTASGDVDVSETRGVLEISTASGDIDLESCRGLMEISTASGDIEASEIVLEDEADFSAASGSIEAVLAESPQFDLEMSTASGSVTLDFNGNPVRGRFEMTARKDRGEIRSPFPFTEEKDYEKYGKTYMRKILVRDAGKPVIRLGTASGRVSLVQ